MNFAQSILVNLVVLVLIFIFFSKNSILVDNTSFSLHKKIGKKNQSPIILGGIYFLFVTIFFFKNLNFDIYIIFTIMFLVGLLSDCNIVSNSLIRFLSQLFLVLLITYFGKLSINDIRINFFDSYLNIQLINTFFVIFCLMVLINGTNFIDGLNGLVVGYYILTILSLIFVTDSYSPTSNTIFDTQFLGILLSSLLFFFIFNIFGKVYMGDSGSYMIALIVGFYVIKIHQIYNISSPYYFALLLWYPAFENLFSLVRRFKTHSEISKPDNKHLHQLIFRYYKIKKYFSEKNCNSLTSLTILIFNIPSFFLASLHPSKTIILVLVLVFNIILYCLIYFKIIFFLKKINK